MNLDLLNQFESEIVSSTQLPYCQIQNPPNLAWSQIEQLNPPYGWFIPAEQSELAGFNATDDWQPTRLTFGEDTDHPRSVDGFLSHHVRIVVLHSSNIEVQSKAKNGWRYCGLAYRNGEITSWGESAQGDRNNYRLRTRYLVMFLDNNNQLLHETPIQIGMNAGVGAAFNTELKKFRKEIETVFFSSLCKPQQQLSDRAHSLTVLDMQLGLHKSEGKAPYLYPAARFTPDKSNHLTRRERTVELIHQPIESMIIPKESDTGRLILDLWQQHQDFGSMYRDDVSQGESKEIEF